MKNQVLLRKIDEGRMLDKRIDFSLRHTLTNRILTIVYHIYINVDILLIHLFSSNLFLE